MVEQSSQDCKISLCILFRIVDYKRMQKSAKEKNEF